MGGGLLFDDLQCWLCAADSCVSRVGLRLECRYCDDCSAGGVFALCRGQDQPTRWSL